MAEIKRLIDNRDSIPNIYDKIAEQVLLMKRLWIGKGLDGLLIRRNEEAELIKSCAV